MKYLVFGLGNIGAEYDNTRHNIGFKVLDAFADASSISFSTERLADVSTAKFKGRIIKLIKPNTYMNLSGKAVQYWMQKEKVSIENILIITDDLALPFGKIRVRGKGSDGGHNGLKSIQALLNSTLYPRLRFGIGDEFSNGNQIDYVLGKWSSTEDEVLNERIELCSKIIQGFVTIGLGRTMSEFNNK